jgi:hypothetical protein
MFSFYEPSHNRTPTGKTWSCQALRNSSFRFQPTVIPGDRFSTWDWNADNETFVVETSHSIIYCNSSHDFWHGTKLHVWWRQAQCLVRQGKRNLEAMTWMLAAVKWLRNSNCYGGSPPCRSSWLRIGEFWRCCKLARIWKPDVSSVDGWRQQFLINTTGWDAYRSTSTTSGYFYADNYSNILNLGSAIPGFKG